MSETKVFTEEEVAKVSIIPKLCSSCLYPLFRAVGMIEYVKKPKDPAK